MIINRSYFDSSGLWSDESNYLGSSAIWSNEPILWTYEIGEIIKNTQLSQGVNVKIRFHFCVIFDRGGCSAEISQILILCTNICVSKQYTILHFQSPQKLLKKQRKCPQKVPESGSERGPFASRKGSFRTPKGFLSQIKCMKIGKSDGFSCSKVRFLSFSGIVSF